MVSSDNSRPALDRRFRGRRGIALLSVLWVLTLLALMASTFTRTARTETNLARNLLENAKAEALADAGVYLATVKLVEPVVEGGWSIDGQVHTMHLGDGEIRVSIADEGGKIDLNLASEDLLRALFRAAGLDGQDGTALADAIVDFRDPDHLHRLNGAEDNHYSAAGLEHGAKDGPFDTVDELRQVIGMTPQLYRQIAPVVTVFSRRPVPNRATAPPLVVAAITGQNPDQTLLDRDQSSSQNQFAEQPGSDIGESVTGTLSSESGQAAGLRSRLGVYAIHAEGRTSDGALFARAAILRLVGRPNTPFQIFEWGQGQPALFGEINAGG